MILVEIAYAKLRILVRNIKSGFFDAIMSFSLQVLRSYLSCAEIPYDEVIPIY